MRRSPPRLVKRIAAWVAVYGALLYAWAPHPRTKFAEGFSQAAFQNVQLGESEAEVLRKLGRPLARGSEEGPEVRCFRSGTGFDAKGAAARLGRWLGLPPEPRCLYFKDNVVVDYQGKPSGFPVETMSEGVRQLGEPEYIKPAGKKVYLRYSDQQHFTDSYEAFWVILDGNGFVRAKEHYYSVD